VPRLLRLRPQSTRRESNPQPAVCKTAARPLSFSSFASGTLESNQVVPAYQAGAFSVWLVPVGWDRVESHHRLLGFDQALALSQLRALAFSPPPSGGRGCPMTTPTTARTSSGRWNGTWVLPPLLLVGSQLCICQHLSRLETRLGVEPSRTWSAATCLAVRPTRLAAKEGFEPSTSRVTAGRSAS
jgi:hypothetical protein